jgi:zearalenone synthase (highly reducing iterative type I polyketide synthase)
MGLELLQYPVFRCSLSQAEQYLKNTLDCEWSVTTELEREDKSSNIQLAKFSQPICTIVQVALVDLLKSWNIKPTGAVGHSSGEIAAAYYYGAISKEDAWTLSYWRGKLCSELTIRAPKLKGAMMAVGLSSETAQGYIAKVSQGKLVVACVNSPSSVTISGDESGVDELNQILKADSVFCRKLKVENAYHSHHMKFIAESYLERISTIHPKVPASADNLKMTSSVTGDIIKHSDLSPEYWVRNLVSPVLFSKAVEALLKDTSRRRRRARKGQSAFDFILEIGPHAALKGPLRQILQDQEIQNVVYKSVLLRGGDAIKTAINAAGTLHIHGASIDILEVNQQQVEARLLVDLPSYPWNHSLKYWAESRISRNYRFRKYGRHDLLGAPAADYNELEPRWRHFLRVNENPWTRDHVVHSSILYPGASTITMVLEAIQQIADRTKTIESIKFRDVHITKAIVIPDDNSGIECFLQMRHQRTGPGGVWNGWWEFTVFTCLEDQIPEENGSGFVTIQYEFEESGFGTNGKAFTREALKKEYQSAKDVCTSRIEPKDFYEAAKTAGLRYGRSFQGLTEILAGKDQCCCIIAIPDTKQAMPANIESPHLLHPTTLDIIFHSMFAAMGNGKLELTKAAVPISIDNLSISMNLPSGANSEFYGFCRTKRDGPRELVADIFMSDSTWEDAKVQISGIRCRELPGDISSNTGGDLTAPLGTLLWKPDIDLLDDERLASYISTTPSAQVTVSIEDLSGKWELIDGIQPIRSLNQALCKVSELLFGSVQY